MYKDFVVIAASEVVSEDYKHLSLERIELFKSLVQLRMVYFEKGFVSHLDLLNKIFFNNFISDAPAEEKINFYSIWNMPTLNGIGACNSLIENDINCKVINNFDSEEAALYDWCASKENPVVGISTTFILTWNEIGRILKKIKVNVPNATFVLGGPFIQDNYTLSGVEFFKKPLKKFGIDYAFLGKDSEKEIVELFKFLNKEIDDISKVNNLLYLDDNQDVQATNLVETKANIVISNNTLNYFSDILQKDKIVQIRTTTGCPFKCAFCNYPELAKGFFKGELGAVRSTFDCLTKQGVEQIIFVDDTFNVPLKRFEAIVELLTEYNFKWYAFLRAQYIDDRIAAKMKASGCDGAYLGLESGDRTILKNMNKKATLEAYTAGLATMKRHQIPTFASFIVGFPGENAETINNTINFIEDGGLDFYSLKEWYYLKSASIYKEREKYELTGDGGKWSHSTMNSQEASEWKLKMFESIQNVPHVDPDMGLWYLIYLRSKGHSWEQIKAYQNIVTEMVREDNQGIFDQKQKYVDRIKKVFDLNSVSTNEGAGLRIA